MQAGRIRRLCLAFSKRFDNHCHAVALGYVWYNVGCNREGDPHVSGTSEPVGYAHRGACDTVQR